MSRSESFIALKPDWATTILEFRRRLNLNQTAFGQLLHSSAMAISRWERGTHEPLAGTYIELGNLAGAPLCWYFWSRAGLRNEDLMRVLPSLKGRLSRTNTVDFEIVKEGIDDIKDIKTKTPSLVAIPLLNVVAASHGGKGDSSELFQDAPAESMVGAPKDWCPNAETTTCLRVRGNSMMPLICDGYVIAVDSAQTYSPELYGKVVLVWNKDMGLMVSRLQHYDHTEVLQPENREFNPIPLNDKDKWKILAKVLWWIGKAP